MSSDIVVLAFARRAALLLPFAAMVEVCMYRFELLVCKFRSKYLLYIGKSGQFLLAFFALLFAKNPTKHDIVMLHLPLH